MRWTGDARIDYFGDTKLAMQYVPLARLLLGQCLNSLKLRNGITDLYHPLSIALGTISVRKFYPGGVMIDAGYSGGFPWARITAGSTSSSIVLEGFGFILSPFNGSSPSGLISPIYDSTLLLINNGAYAHDYPDADHTWFTSPTSGGYLALGNEFAGNPLLQGNLHWRSTVDPSFHLSWLGNSSDPIPYFKIDFQNGYDGGNSPYTVRLSPTTATPSQSGSIYNFDTTEVFSVWLADMFGGLNNLQNGTGIGQVICYKGHVVKSVYDLLKPGSPIVARNCIVGVGGTVDPDTKIRTLYFIARVFLHELPEPSTLLTEQVYSLDIDTPMAIPVLIGSRTIAMTGTYNTPVAVDPIPLHGYQWNETTLQFVCVAVQANTTPFADASNDPEFRVQHIAARTGKLTWTIASGVASYSFSGAQNLGAAYTQRPIYNYHGHSDIGIFNTAEFGDEPYNIATTFDVSMGYIISNGLIGVTPLHDVTTTVAMAAEEHGVSTDSDFIFNPAAPVVAHLTAVVTESTSASLTQSVACGSKSWNVVAYSQTSSSSETQSYTDDTFSVIHQVLHIENTFSYTGISFLFFDDVNSVFAYLEFQLAWTQITDQNYTIPVIGGIPPPPTVSFTVPSYQGRYVVESPAGTQTGAYFDLTASGKVGDVAVLSANASLWAFMAQLPIHVSAPSAPATVEATLISFVDTPTEVDTVYKLDYGSTLPLYEQVNNLSFSRWNIPNWQTSSGFFTAVGGRKLAASETDGTYSFEATHPGGWAMNGKRLCFSQIGPLVVNSSGGTVSQAPFDYLTTGDLATLTGATGDDRGYYPLCYLASKEIKAQGQS